MKVITALTRKGGSGKTTLIRALAAAALSQNKRSVLVDADPQKALYRWAERTGYENPKVAVKSIDKPAELEPLIEEAEASGKIDYIFIDTMGAAGSWADLLVGQSDHLVCPMMPSATDLQIATDTFNYYCDLRAHVDEPELLPSFRVVLARMPSKPSKSMFDVAREALKRFPVIDELFMQRVQHEAVDLEGGLLPELADRLQNDPNPLKRTHAKHFHDAVQEACTILSQVEAKK
ncbi:AAA family ATPase [Notoacmeibacter ruber]|uniref:ParA family protein n=1 Tax=Notoacmeibacter ruber TaxID=2670375 RepID=A0A3L7J641_9HYPH|nr:AAA family ATPase [Notoacmeibacter ruber]RLQ84971.1 hypothetical protein D8780_15400 [Notoacmeibacter ruber]